MPTIRKRALSKTPNDQHHVGWAGPLPPPLPISLDFVGDALANYENVVRYHLMVQAYEHGAKSLRDIARSLYYGPRHLGATLPDYVDRGHIRLVGGKLDTKRLSIANFQIEALFTKYFGMGRLLACDGEGLGFDHLTKDGRRAAKLVAWLIHHWTEFVLTAG
jgi:hypothetical protein